MVLYWNIRKKGTNILHLSIILASKAGKDSIKLAEEVTDCGPVIDVEKTPDCVLLEDAYNVTLAFPNCCPVYDCVEGADITYVVTKRNDAKGNKITAKGAGN